VDVYTEYIVYESYTNATGCLNTIIQRDIVLKHFLWLQKAVKVDESVREEDIPVKKRIAHEAAQKYPPQVAASPKPQINPMRVSCIVIVPKIWVGSPIHLNKFIVHHTPTRETLMGIFFHRQILSLLSLVLFINLMKACDT
jgi:hypothetical protein